MCAAVPGKYAKECKDFVDEYGPTVVDLVINEVESGVICNRLLLCAVPLPIQQEVCFADCMLNCYTLLSMMVNRSTASNSRGNFNLIE